MKIRYILAALLIIASAHAAEPQTDWTESLKKIPLADDPEYNISLGGKARLRWENWNNFGFSDANDDNFLLSRFLLNADLRLGKQLRFFVEGIYAESTERDLPGGHRTLDVDRGDLQQAFVDLMLPVGGGSLTLRPGRQELLYGKQRLVSPLDWANTRRTFDGGKIFWSEGATKVDAFYTELVPVDKSSFNDGDSGQDFYGIYASHKITDTWSVDIYWLGLDKDGSVFGVATNTEKRQTIGMRTWGTCSEKAVDYDIEVAYQFGDHGDSDISAWMFASEIGYTFASDIKPRLQLGFDYASGDDDPSDGDIKTFNQLFPLGHAFFGYADFVGRQNIMDLSAGLSCKPVSFVTARLDGHLFRRAESADSLYNAGGAVVRRGDAGSSKDIGSEIDLLIRIDLDKHTVCLLGYSRFFAGDFIEESGPSEDIDFIYASVEYTF